MWWWKDMPEQASKLFLCFCTHVCRNFCEGFVVVVVRGGGGGGIMKA
jgi:hypothetical protein